MRNRLLLTALLLAAAATTAAGHDLFLRLRTFFVPPNSTARVEVLNGTFSKSEGAVARSRLRDLSLVAHGRRAQLDTTLWSAVDTTLAVVRVPVGEPGTYVLGASLLHRQITIQGADFNEYLRTEGILPIIDRRRQRNEMGVAARERYHKHVKAFIQVGSTRTADFSTRFNYPAELVPQENPYSLRRGSRLPVLALVEGAAAPGQVILAGGRMRSGARIPQQRVRAGTDGVARIRLTHAGHWYVKFIHMEPVASDSLDYESKWATMTFEVR